MFSDIAFLVQHSSVSYLKLTWSLTTLQGAAGRPVHKLIDNYTDNPVLANIMVFGILHRHELVYVCWFVSACFWRVHCAERRKENGGIVPWKYIQQRATCERARRPYRMDCLCCAQHTHRHTHLYAVHRPPSRAIVSTESTRVFQFVCVRRQHRIDTAHFAVTILRPTTTTTKPCATAASRVRRVRGRKRSSSSSFVVPCIFTVCCAHASARSRIIPRVVSCVWMCVAHVCVCVCWTGMHLRTYS